ncbi:MAG TPA: competence/damage-inducible protein A [Acidimicrobiales bacterium]|nr:competence/damage-inducible protein A [Acidimicrobiales bacterium]
MRAEVVAVGTELLLGYVVDTNSAWIGEQLALAGVDCLRATKVGDNVERIADALRGGLQRADAVIVCGGLGPTSDDLTREALAAVMGVELRRDPVVEERIAGMFRAVGMAMGDSNRHQADVPTGATVIEQVRGTAPGLVCPVGGGKVVYAVPGVPAEMREMVTRAVLPDLAARAGAPSVIATRTLRTWGAGESAVAERLADRVAALEGGDGVAIAYLASAAEGVKVRLSAKRPTVAAAAALLDEEEGQVRARLGDLVTGVDDATLEVVVGELLRAGGRRVAVAESLTAGMVAARLVDVPGASAWVRGGVVAYAGEVKHRVLGVPDGPVVTAAAAEAMAVGVAMVCGADCGLAVTGVAGPDPQEGEPPGTVFVGSYVDGAAASERLRLPGGRVEVRVLTVGAALDHLRRRLLGLPLRGWTTG